MHLSWESHFAAAPAAGWRNLPKTNFFLQRRICPLRESAQKLYFLTRENLPSQFQGICPFKESAQMMIFGEGRFLLVKKNNFCADPSYNSALSEYLP